MEGSPPLFCIFYLPVIVSRICSQEICSGGYAASAEDRWELAACIACAEQLGLPGAPSCHCNQPPLQHLSHLPSFVAAGRNCRCTKQACSGTDSRGCASCMGPTAATSRTFPSSSCASEYPCRRSSPAFVARLSGTVYHGRGSSGCQSENRSLNSGVSSIGKAAGAHRAFQARVSEHRSTSGLCWPLYCAHRIADEFQVGRVVSRTVGRCWVARPLLAAARPHPQCSTPPALPRPATQKQQ